MQAKNLDEFLSIILEQRPYPRYFDRMRSLNISGAPLFGGQPPDVGALAIDAFDRVRHAGACVVDLRPFNAFDLGHIPGSFSIGLDGPFSAWAGWVLPPNRSLAFVADEPRQVREAIRQLFRIGYDGAVGYLEGGMKSWNDDKRQFRAYRLLDSGALVERLRSDQPSLVIDVREADEFAQGHIPGSLPLPVPDLVGRRPALPYDVDLIVHCAHGYRSALALSLLEQAGFERLFHAPEGFEGWSALRRNG